MEKLKINSLNLEIDKKTILNNISITLNRGETLTIIGESGSGKTILSKLLIGIKPYNANIKGNIYYDNKDLLKFSENDWKEYRGKKIAYISQNPMAVFNNFQSIESHAIELFQSQLNLSKKESVEKIILGMKELNLQHSDILIKKYPFQLSGGMLQRIMFAMMIQLNPEMIIADEPTSALDYYNSEKILELLNIFKSNPNNKKEIIVITHDYELAEKLNGNIIIMKNGNIIEKGKSSEILKNPKSEYGKKLLLKKSHIRYKEV